MISGIDEAGKGPVLGPMCVAGVLFEEKNLDELALLGVRDSKKLSANRREVLASDIKRLADRYFILEVSPSRIDELRKVMTMNEIMVLSFSNVLEVLRPGHAVLDAADVNAERFGENVRKKYGRKIAITSEHKADDKYPVVSAASILAKVERDALVKKLEDNAGEEIGSGYPADPKTMQFLEKYVKEHGYLPEFARSSWETSRNLLERYEQRTLFDY